MFSSWQDGPVGEFCSSLEKNKQKALLHLAGSVFITHTPAFICFGNVQGEKTKQLHPQTAGRADFCARYQPLIQPCHVPAFWEIKEKHSHLVVRAAVISLVCIFPREQKALIKVKGNK